MAYEVVKTEHNGAKHGAGAWMTKEQAKKGSKKARRSNDRKAVEAGA